jgi:uncharacterized protein YndB with AHSA1/START domain
MPKLELFRKIAASPATVFDALITAEGLAAWWGPDDGPMLIAESDPRVDGQYRVRFRMQNGEEHEARGKFLVIDRPHRVEMSFQWIGAEDDTGPSHLQITLRPNGNQTELTFIHADLRDEKIRESHEHGWNGSLDKLVAMFAQ